MCGLLGIAVRKGTKLTPELAGYLVTQLVMRNEGRGGDSFGLGIVQPDTKDVRLFKTVGKITNDGVYEKSWGNGVSLLINHMIQDKTAVAIGHNRKATTGANTTRNAHPFLCGKPDREDFVLGAHNGVISTWNEVRKYWSITHDMEVDSEVIFRGIQKFHNESDADIKVLSQLFPMGMLSTVHMMDMQKINFFRGDNPLAIAIGDGFVVWSSVETHLKETLFGLNVDIEDLRDGCLVRLDLDTFKTTTTEVEPDNKLQNELFPKRLPFHGREPVQGRMGVIIGDKRSSTIVQRRDVGFYRHLFRDHSVDDTGSHDDDDVRTLGHRTIVDQMADSKYAFSLVPKSYTITPRDRSNKIQCVGCEHEMRDIKNVTPYYEPWQLLWRGADPLCPTCYYYLVQADAERNISLGGRE